MYGRYFYARYPRDAVSAGAGPGAVRRAVLSSSTRARRSATPTTSAPTLVNNFIASWNYNDGNALSGAPFSLPSIGLPIADADAAGDPH